MCFYIAMQANFVFVGLKVFTNGTKVFERQFLALLAKNSISAVFETILFRLM